MSDRRRAVAQDTIQRIAKFTAPPKSVKYSFTTIPIASTTTPRFETKITFVENDTASACYDLVAHQHCDENSIAALNFASDRVPGGGWINGMAAQEENLFYRSDYSRTLLRNFYPLKDDELVFSPAVTFFRDRDFRLLSNPVTVGCIACAAIRHPKIVSGGKYEKSQYDLTCEKVRSIYRTALAHGRTTLVLGAFGCGVFGGSPSVTIAIFRKVNGEFAGRFKEIVFAVIGENVPQFREAFA
jgi:uncharacterized protein (TIGR02452 family)